MIRPELPGLGLPVNSIFCIGRNYAEHARELNNPIPKNPVIFTKPATSLIFDGDTIRIPDFTNDVHHEAEIVVAIGKSGKNIPIEKAADYIAGFAAGIDVTARDIQSRLKEKSHPWDTAKGLDTFAPVSNFVSTDKISDLNNISIRLSVNDTIRQDGNSKDMIFPITELISRLSKFFTLSPGDLIFTGTPEGVAKIVDGDSISVSLNDDLCQLKVTVADAD